MGHASLPDDVHTRATLPTQMGNTSECHEALSDVLAHLNLSPQQQVLALAVAAADACVSAMDSGTSTGHASSTAGTSLSKAEMVLLVREIDAAELGGQLTAAEAKSDCLVSLAYQ